VQICAIWRNSVTLDHKKWDEKSMFFGFTLEVGRNEPSLVYPRPLLLILYSPSASGHEP